MVKYSCERCRKGFYQTLTMIHIIDTKASRQRTKYGKNEHGVCRSNTAGGTLVFHRSQGCDQ